MAEIPEKYDVINNPAANRFEVRIGDYLSVLEYEIDETTIYLTHTEVPPALGGRGIAGRLAQTALDFARANEMQVVPECSYVNAYIRKHPEYQDLVG